MSRQIPTASDRPSHEQTEAALRRELANLQERLLREPKNVEALGQAAALLHEMGRQDEAAAHLQQALKVCPTDADQLRSRLLMQLANCHAAALDYTRAERCCQAALATTPQQAAPYITLATLALERGQTEQAERFYRAARELEPHCSEAHTGLAMIFHQSGDYEQAFEMYLEALRHDTDNLVALLGLFQTSCQMGDFSQIIHYLEVYLEGHEDDVSVQFCLATLYAREGRLDDARRITLHVLAVAPDKPEAAELLAELDAAQAAVECG